MTQEVEKVSSIEVQAERLMTLLVNALESGLEQIPAAAQMAYDSIQWYYIAVALSKIGIGIIFLILAILSSKITWKAYQKLCEESGEFYEFVTVVGFGITIFGLIAGVITVASGIANLPRAISPLGYILSKQLGS